MRSRVVKALKELGGGLAQLAYPARCFACGCSQPEFGLCYHCDNRIQPVLPPQCCVCGEPHPGEMASEYRCGNCSSIDFAFEFATAGYLYRGPVRRLIQDFKYHRRLVLAPILAELTSRVLDDARLDPVEDWLLVPVPLHRRRKRERGYNQAAEIATALAKLRDLPYCDALRRDRYTSAQARLDREERLENLRSAFRLRGAKDCRARIEGQRILLIDDVFTTGATADACARVLTRDGGAQKVVVATAARG